jgi:RNA recognition motif-containing protein
LRVRKTPTLRLHVTKKEQVTVRRAEVKRLYIGNLPYRATEADLTSWFQQQGVNTGAVSVMRDRFSNESRGFGFAEVDVWDLERAVEACNGKQFMGRALVINEARPMEKGGGRRTRTSGGDLQE